MPFELPALPWSEAALEPHISAKTLGFHFGKHHATYVAKLNDAVSGSALAEQSLEEVIRTTAQDPARIGVFNNAAQAWNHTFFWRSMDPKGGGEPGGELAAKIQRAFGSFTKFREEFAAKATTLFGSGWVWLVDAGDKVEILQTSNAATPLAEGKKPLMTLDVWEHAYYLDYQNRRPDFVKAFLNNLVNWEFASQNLGS